MDKKDNLDDTQGHPSLDNIKTILLNSPIALSITVKQLILGETNDLLVVDVDNVLLLNRPTSMLDCVQAFLLLGINVVFDSKYTESRCYTLPMGWYEYTEEGYIDSSNNSLLQLNEDFSESGKYTLTSKKGQTTQHTAKDKVFMLDMNTYKNKSYELSGIIIGVYAYKDWITVPTYKLIIDIDGHEIILDASIAITS